MNAIHPDEVPGKSDPHDSADPDDYVAISPTEATAKNEDHQDADTWGRSTTEPDLGEVDEENTYLPEAMPDQEQIDELLDPEKENEQ